MSNLKNEVATLLSEAGTDVIHNFFQSEGNEIGHWTKDEDEAYIFMKASNERNITYAHVDNYGGEGLGDEYWSVYKFTKGKDEVFVKFNGGYQSYSGSDFDEYFFVEPEEKVITVFSRTK